MPAAKLSNSRQWLFTASTKFTPIVKHIPIHNVFKWSGNQVSHWQLHIFQQLLFTKSVLNTEMTGTWAASSSKKQCLKQPVCCISLLPAFIATLKVETGTKILQAEWNSSVILSVFLISSEAGCKIPDLEFVFCIQSWLEQMVRHLPSIHVQ